MVSTSPSRIYLARLAGAMVLDTSGDQVGRVRDLVVTARAAGRAPVVLGLVVEVAPRRRIYVPMSRVTSFDPGAVVTSGMVNLKRFERRVGERLVLAELVESRVRVASSGERVVVEDIAMTSDRSRTWVVSRIFVRKAGNGLRRRGPTATFDWNEIEGLFEGTEPQGVDSLLASVESMRPADLANLIADLPDKRQLELVAALGPERLADVFEEMSEDLRVRFLGALEMEHGTEVLEEMDPGDAADMLSELPPETAAAYLDAMEPEDAEELRRLLSYDDYSAGGMMTTEPVIVSTDATVAEALARVRQPELSPAVASQVYVVRPPLETPTGRFIGTAHVQRLLREPPSSLVSAVIDSSLEPIGPGAPLSRVARYFATYNLVALPVVDENDRLLGAVTIDDVIDHMLPAHWRDAQDEEV